VAGRKLSNHENIQGDQSRAGSGLGELKERNDVGGGGEGMEKITDEHEVELEDESGAKRINHRKRR